MQHQAFWTFVNMTSEDHSGLQVLKPGLDGALSPWVGTVQVTILELAGTGRHGHTTCCPQQPDWGQHRSQLFRGRVLFSEVGGLFVARDHA